MSMLALATLLTGWWLTAHFGTIMEVLTGPFPDVAACETFHETFAAQNPGTDPGECEFHTVSP